HSIQSSAELRPLETPITFIMEGEALPATVLRTLRTLAPNGNVIKRLWTTALIYMDNTSGEIVSISRPLANRRIYILDVHGQPVPGLTAKVFFPDLFSGDEDARMYATLAYPSSCMSISFSMAFKYADSLTMEPAATMEDMAIDYIDQVRRIQPHEPYCLLGYPFGGMVAHTMAAHLECQGESVALLAVMDSIP
ncbi:hypothetical protein BGZ65_009776, partial [Modicella reniformis]